MFSIRIQLWKAIIIIISFFLTGILLSLAFLYLTWKKFFHKNKITESLQMEMIIEDPRIEKIMLDKSKSAIENETTRENFETSLEPSDSKLCDPSLDQNAIDYSKVKSKYWDLLSQKKNPKFKNFLHKSDKPFLGYNSSSKDKERKKSSFNENKKFKNEKL